MYTYAFYVFDYYLIIIINIYIYTNQIISIHNNGIYEKTWEENGNLQLL